MTATINASTTAGVVTTADTSGILQLQTNGTAALTVDASQNVGIGTSSNSARLNVNGGTSTSQIRWEVNNAAFTQEVSTNAAANAYVYKSNDALYHVWKLSSSEAMRIDSSGNVGIGTSSPSSKLHVVSSSGENKIISEATAASQQASLSLIVQAATPGQTVIYMGKTGATTNGQLGYDPNTNAMTMYTNNAERMRIDSSGRMLINTTTPQARLTVRDAGDWVIATIRTGTGGEGHIRFDNANGNVGSIQTSGSSTSYVTSSDYRLKEAIAPMTGALATVAQLKPVNYKWKVDGSDGQGFIAHELAEVVPDCVTGEKDAVQEEQYEVTPAVKDEEGNIVADAVMGTRTVPVYQGIDTSFLVATLTAAIQELKAIVDGQAVLIAAQGAEIAALKGATA